MLMKIITGVFFFFYRRNSEKAFQNFEYFTRILFLSLIVPGSLLIEMMLSFSINGLWSGENGKIAFYIISLGSSLYSSKVFLKKVNPALVSAIDHKNHSRKRDRVLVWMVLFAPIFNIFFFPILLGIINGSIRINFFGLKYESAILFNCF